MAATRALTVPDNSGNTSATWAPKLQSPLQRAAIRVLHNPMGIFGATVLGILGVMAIFAPLLAPYDPLAQHAGSELLPPNTQFWLGTDQFGRDELSRIIYGARVSFIVAVAATSVGAVTGVLAGLLAGYARGGVDSVVMRICDALFAFPAILLGIGLVTVLGPSLFSTALALAIAQAPYYARVMRGSVLTVRDQEFVVAAHSFGAGGTWIALRHILPNCTTALLVQLSLSLGFSVLAEAGLSFIGLGVQPPAPSWGNMLSESQRFVDTAPWLALWPGLTIALLVLGLNFLSDAIRDSLAP
ncbi:MAG: ABC transporter permease [Chloroflexi bacterium]|nr:ABC transporter permease [Chloroflexota bacterium]